MGDRYVTLSKREDREAYSPRGYAPRSGHDTSKAIYVGQLRYDTNERTVRKWFEAYGSVAAVKLIYDKETGRSKGFGFVTFDDDRDARDALNDAGGRDLDGATIKVNIAHGPPILPPFAGGRGRGRGFYSSGRGAGPLRPDPRGRGFDRRTVDERYSPGRYSPRSRSRSRSRSPSRKHEREDREQCQADDVPADKRRRHASPSRSRSHSSGRSGSPSSSRSRSRSGTPPSGHPAADERSPRHTDDAAAAPPAMSEPAISVPPATRAPPTRSAPISEQTPPGMGVAAAVRAAMPSAKPPPSAEAVKKELLRLRKQVQELGGRVCSLEDRLAKRDSQLTQRDQALYSAQQELAALRPQLQQYKQWVAALLEGTGKLISSRRAVAAAEAETQRREEGLAALQRDIEADAPRIGMELANGGNHLDADTTADEDAAWEQLAADIQESERMAAAAGGSDGKMAVTAEQAPQAPGSALPVQPPPTAQASDMALQTVMQEAAMEGIEDA